MRLLFKVPDRSDKFKVSMFYGLAHGQPRGLSHGKFYRRKGNIVASANQGSDFAHGFEGFWDFFYILTISEQLRGPQRP